MGFSSATLAHINAANACPCNTDSSSTIFNTYPSQLTPQLMKFGFRSSFGFSCVLDKQSAGQAVSALQRPHSIAGYGDRGGNYVPETLMFALAELESAFKALPTDHDFQKELEGIMRNYACRESPLYFAQGLTEYYKRPNGEGPDIYFKREDVNPLGLHKMNNAVAQALLAKKLGKTRIITEAGAGQHGVATATVCEQFGLKCSIYMGTQDIERQGLDVFRMMHLGAEVKPVHSGTAALKDATLSALRDWAANVETTHYLSGSVAGPHPYPTMVREFLSVIGKETRKQAMEKWGGKPDVLVSCVDGESNAMGLFHEFLEDEEVRLIGVRAAGSLLDSGKHAAPLTKGEVSLCNEAVRYLVQDDGQHIDLLSIHPGLDYPEHNFLKVLGRGELYSITDEEALEAFKRVPRLEGITPGLEASHALAYLEKLCPTLANGTKVVLNCSPRKKKDYPTAIKYLQV